MSATDTLVRRARWRWRYVHKQSRRRARSWFVTLPWARSTRRSLWLCSWQRSGSTWLAEMLSSPSTSRLIYEPANLHQSIFDGKLAATVPLPKEDSPELGDVLRALRGKLRGPWVDQLNHAILVSHRVVKDVRGAGFAGAVGGACRETPLVVLVRHPLAVARSVVALGWTTERDPLAAMKNEIELWCAAHVALFSDERLQHAFFVSYESLRQSPDDTVRSIVQYAGTFDQSWLRIKRTPPDPLQRSATDFRATSSGAPAGWDELDPAAVTHAGHLLRAHGLSGLYDESPGCRREVHEFVREFRASASH